ncbi:MAG: MipA/OmpV family protein [Pseudomonadales bacterium]|nr:MipA/OmpV family protein [Pseudomonadales bacterium]
MIKRKRLKASNTLLHLILFANCSANAEPIMYPGHPVECLVASSPSEQNALAVKNSPIYTAENNDGGSGLYTQKGWNISLGIGIAYAPMFVGSKDYQAMVFPNIKAEYSDKFFASLVEGIGYNIVDINNWRAGPLMKLNFGRDEEGSGNPLAFSGNTDALRGLGDVDMTLELGGFIEHNYQWFTAKVELRQGMGGHDGFVGELVLNYKGKLDSLAKPIMYIFGPRATFADSTYSQAFFGISSSQSESSGLEQYKADAGLLSYGIGGIAVMPITRSISASIYGGYDRLGNIATKSPLIKERGEDNQLMAGAGIRYQF